MHALLKLEKQKCYFVTLIFRDSHVKQVLLSLENVFYFDNINIRIGRIRLLCAKKLLPLDH